MHAFLCFLKILNVCPNQSDARYGIRIQDEWVLLTPFLHAWPFICGGPVFRARFRKSGSDIYFLLKDE